MRHLLALVLILSAASADDGQLPAETIDLLKRAAAVGQDAQRILDAQVQRPTSGAELQAALERRGEIALTGGVVYEAPRFTFRSGTILRGNGATLRATSGPALYVPPGTTDVQVFDLAAGSSSLEAVIQLGDNDARTQSSLEQVPQRITLTRVSVPTHRGKRAFEFNATRVELRDCSSADVWHPQQLDSQGIAILNTPGQILIEGGIYSAGSEPFLSGGDVLKIPGIVIADVTVRNVVFSRPLSWRTDGVRRLVKNLIELKHAHRFRFIDVTADGVWPDGQSGYALMLTPTRAGSVVDVVFERLTVVNVGGGINVTGYDSHGISTVRTTGIVFRDSRFSITRQALGGSGWFLLMTDGPGSLEFERVSVQHDGTSFVYHSGAMVERLRFVDGAFNAGKYGFNVAGVPNAGDWRAGVQALEVTGNTITGASSVLRANLPGNTYQ